MPLILNKILHKTAVYCVFLWIIGSGKSNLSKPDWILTKHFYSRSYLLFFQSRYSDFPSHRWYYVYMSFSTFPAREWRTVTEKDVIGLHCGAPSYTFTLEYRYSQSCYIYARKRCTWTCFPYSPGTTTKSDLSCLLNHQGWCSPSSSRFTKYTLLLLYFPHSCEHPNNCWSLNRGKVRG